MIKPIVYNIYVLYQEFECDNDFLKVKTCPLNDIFLSVWTVYKIIIIIIITCLNSFVYQN